MSKSKYLIIIVGLFLSSCQYFEPQEEQSYLARVNDNYLYKEDIEGLVNENTPKEDSTFIINNYITKWATQQLLIDKAKLNISFEKQQEFEELVQSYKNELYTKAYADAYVAKRLDTSLSKSAIEEYYLKNRENFKLNEDLVKLRYISISKENNNLSEVKNHFKKFEAENKQALEEIMLQFNSYSFNDSVWVKTKDVYQRIPLLNNENKEELFKKTNYFELEDSLSVYLVHINDVRLRYETAPLVYVEPTIKQILLNKKKLELIKELEKDIIKDALKNKNFEINK